MNFADIAQIQFSDFAAVPRYPYLHKSNTYIGTYPSHHHHTTVSIVCQYIAPALIVHRLPWRQPVTFAALPRRC